MAQRIHYVVGLIFFTSMTIFILPIMAQVNEPVSNSLESLLKTYTTDRSNLIWTYDTPLSEQRQNRMQQFYGDWQARQKRINFDHLKC